ncbi:MAG: Lpp/OprI family alanine-zipper lipoprotein [Gammaproteobacteria bacterium]
MGATNKRRRRAIMQSTLITAARATVLAVSVGLTAACATTGDLERVEGVANNALSTAQAAQQTAGAAQAASDSAASVATEAKSDADAAQSCCTETSDKIDRMFQRSMQK